MYALLQGLSTNGWLLPQAVGRSTLWINRAMSDHECLALPGDDHERYAR